MSPLVLRVVACAVAVVAFLALCAGLAQSLKAQGKEEAQTAAQAQHVKDVQEARARDEAIAYRNQEADDVHSQMVARNAADAGRAADSAQRLLQRARSIDARRVSADPAAASASSASPDLANVVAAVVDFARRSAAGADTAVAAGRACEQHYQALTP